MGYPDNFIRGMSNKDQCISEEGFVLAGAFIFDKFDVEKNPDYCELSINWCDDDGAINVAKQQINVRTGLNQFAAGLARIDRRKMELVMKGHMDSDILKYERKPIFKDIERNIVENRYHGNLLLKNNASTAIKKLIPNALAMLASNDII